MIARIFFGTKETPIGIDEFLLKCPSCEGYSPADVMVVSKYFHFVWIPFFPFEKDANVICKTCGLKRYGMNFDAKSFGNYEQINENLNIPSSLISDQQFLF